MHKISAAEQAELIATAHALADAARLATLQHFRQPDLTADTKEAARFDPVTVADSVTKLSQGDVGPAMQALGTVIVDALKGIFKYL